MITVTLHVGESVRIQQTGDNTLVATATRNGLVVNWQQVESTEFFPKSIAHVPGNDGVMVPPGSPGSPEWSERFKP